MFRQGGGRYISEGMLQLAGIVIAALLIVFFVLLLRVQFDKSIPPDAKYRLPGDPRSLRAMILKERQSRD